MESASAFFHSPFCAVYSIFIASYPVTSYHHPCNLLKMSKSLVKQKIRVPSHDSTPTKTWHEAKIPHFCAVVAGMLFLERPLGTRPSYYGGTPHIRREFSVLLHSVRNPFGTTIEVHRTSSPVGEDVPLGHVIRAIRVIRVRKQSLR